MFGSILINIRSIRTYALAATLGISVGLNVFLTVQVLKPDIWHKLKLATIRPPIVGPEDHIRGSPVAAVTIIEYSDFQCPFCAELHPTLKALVKEGKIRWVYRNYPLPSIHPQAMEAAEAAECADSQDKFWEYADGLFEEQHELGMKQSAEAFFMTLAARVGLDPNRFNACLWTQQFDGRIRSEIAEGNSKGIDATPTFFVNGHRQVGSVPYEQLEKLVDSFRR